MLRLSRISAMPLMPIPPMPMKCACWEVANIEGKLHFNIYAGGGFLAAGQNGVPTAAEHRQHLCLGRIDGESVLGAQLLHLAMLDEAVGPADADHRNRAAQLGKRFNHSRAEAAHLHVVLKGDKSRSEEHTSEL